MTTAIILNIVFSALVLIALLVHIIRAIVTQHHDRGVTLVSGEKRHRWVWTRPTRPGSERRASERPGTERSYGGQAWPAA
jgi:hypothetical protein